MPQTQSKPAAKPIKRLSDMSLSISKHAPDPHSEIEGRRARDWEKSLLRVLDRREGFAFRADDLFHRRLRSLLIPLACRPGHRERTGVIDREAHFQVAPDIDQPIAFNDMQFVRMRSE